MNDAQTPQGTAAPAAPQHASAAAIAAGANAPPPAQATPPAEPQKPPPNGAGDTPAWLPERLEKAKRSAQTELLKELGVDSADALKTLLDEHKALKQATMTEAQKQQAELDELRPKAAKVEQLTQLTTSIVESQFASLPEAQRTAIDQVANGNAETRWQLMQMFRAAGGSLPEAAPAPPTPATTTGGAAPPPSPTAPQTKWDEYQAMKKSDPMAASIFYGANAIAIERSAPAET